METASIRRGKLKSTVKILPNMGALKKRQCVGSFGKECGCHGNIGFSEYNEVSIDRGTNNDRFLLWYFSYVSDVIIYTKRPIHVCFLADNFRCGRNKLSPFAVLLVLKSTSWANMSIARNFPLDVKPQATRLANWRMRQVPSKCLETFAYRLARSYLLFPACDM